MKVAVIVFPGSDCDLDMYWAMKEIMSKSVDELKDMYNNRVIEK